MREIRSAMHTQGGFSLFHILTNHTLRYSSVLRGKSAKCWVSTHSSGSMGKVCTVILIKMLLWPMFLCNDGSFSAVNILNHPLHNLHVFQIFSTALETFQSCWAFKHFHGRREVAELNGAKFYGTACGTSSTHTHSEDMFPYGMLSQLKHPSWMTPHPLCARLYTCVFCLRAGAGQLSQIEMVGWGEKALGIVGRWV